MGGNVTWHAACLAPAAQVMTQDPLADSNQVRDLVLGVRKRKGLKVRTGRALQPA